MKIKSIRLHPFAGIKNEKIELSDGLNLILGPNEAGKSTVFNAIQHGLLTTTYLPAGQLERVMGEFFPISGGDVIRVTLEFYKENPDQIYTVIKEWKPGTRNGSASLKTPEGNEYTDENKIQQEIENILPVTPGTMKEILLSRQSALHNSLSRVKNADDVKQEIGGILRKSVMEAGGISVDKFKQVLDKQYKGYFDNWDRDKNYPMTDSRGNDKGIHNRHKNNVGDVLKAWYAKEDQKLKLEGILQFEDEMDALNAELDSVHKELQKNAEKFTELKPKLDQQQERAILEGQKENIENKFEEVSKIADSWPVYEHQLKESEPKLERLNEKLEKLNDEQKKASKKSEISALKERIDKLEDLEGKIVETKADLDDTTKVTEEDVDAVRTLKNEIRQKETQIQASKLSVKIEALKDTEFTISGTDEEKVNESLKKGEKKTITQNGVFSLETDRLKVHVTAGEEDLSSIAEDLKQLQVKQKELLSNFDAKDFSELGVLQKHYQGKVNQLATLQQQLKDALGDDSLKQLKAKLEEAGDLADVRDPEAIQKEKDQAFEKRVKLKGKVEEMKSSIEDWQEEYTDKNGLFGKRSELTTKIKELEEELDKTEELPDDFDSLKAFKEYVDELSSNVDVLREKRHEIENKATEKEAKAPNISSEEQQLRKDEAVFNFEKILKEAESLARVKERTDAILAELEQQTYTPLADGLLKWLAKMSDGRFSDIKLDEEGKEIPSAFVTGDNMEIPFHLLSHGTKDLTALAWKLTVSEKFLSEQNGMVLLDDPMVDMDPERKKMASSALLEFSGNQQVIMFTCHPETAKTLKGDINTISI